MRQYLSDYINTLTARRAEHVSDLLEEARQGKEQLDVLAARLATEFSEFAPLSLSFETPESPILAENIRSASRDIGLHVADLFAVSNLISLLLDSHAAVLASDVKAIEDELIVMSKMVDNYAFLLSDNQAFDYAHLEPFTDDSNRDRQLYSIPDRGMNRAFGPAEMAKVRNDEGVLTLPDQAVAGHGLTAWVVDGNAKAFTVSDTGVHNAVTPSTTTGWKVTVAAAGPIRAPLTGSTVGSGAQFLVEFVLTSPSPSSVIKLVPYSEMSSQIVQVTVFESLTDNQGHNLLVSPEKFDRPISLRFPTRRVARFRVLLNQPTYERSMRSENQSEIDYVQMIRDRHGAEDEAIEDAERHARIYQRVLLIHDLYADRYPIRMPKPGRNRARYRKMARIVRELNSTLWKQQKRRRSDIVMRLIDQTVLLQELKTALFRSNRQDPQAYADQIPNPYNPSGVPVGGFNYYYTLGLHSAEIGTTAPGAKGVFVSEPLEAAGSVGEVRLKTSESDYSLPNTSRHSPVVTSVEYSVSNVADPVEETDWTPILPVDHTRIAGERVLPNAVGQAAFRFPADPQNITVYKNGMRQDFAESSFRRDRVTSAVLGVDIPSESYNFGDIFTVDYSPIRSIDHTTVNFKELGRAAEAPLVGAHDGTGPGERFAATGSRNTVDIMHAPFVDTNLTKSSTTYSPITVRLDTGEVAQNLTAYPGRRDYPFPPSGYYYKHSGNTLIFNQPITTPFRVYYQYLENTVRVRVVLRANSTELASPKVDFYHLKARTSQVE